MKVKNSNLPNETIKYKGKKYQSDGRGVFKMDEDAAKFFLGTRGFEPARKPLPAKAGKDQDQEEVKAPTTQQDAVKLIKELKAENKTLRATVEELTQKLREAEEALQSQEEDSEDSGPTEDENGDETGAEEGSEGEEDEIPPYEEWAYADLVKEVSARKDRDDPPFEAPDGRSAEDLVAALKADDEATADE